MNERTIKTWINELNQGKVFSPDSILIRRESEQKTRIVLLDKACCRPSLLVEKPLEQIEKNDLEQLKHIINHRH